MPFTDDQRLAISAHLESFPLNRRKPVTEPTAARPVAIDGRLRGRSIGYSRAPALRSNCTTSL
jgi:hypothetical protein